MKSGTKKSGFPLSESVGAMVRMTHQAFAQDLQNHLASFRSMLGSTDDLLDDNEMLL